jgi:hypothetical protein
MMQKHQEFACQRHGIDARLVFRSLKSGERSLPGSKNEAINKYITALVIRIGLVITADSLT